MKTAKKNEMICTVAKEYESITVFDKLKKNIDILCAGDSLTGWNNRKIHPSIWPFPTYPSYLQEILNENGHGLCIANAGIAGSTSDIGFFTIMDCISMFEKAKIYVIGFGANDLGRGSLTEFDKKIGLTESDIYKPHIKEITETAIKNLDRIIESITSEGKKSILINVPNVNEAICPKEIVQELREKRDYFNENVANYFAGKVPIVDIHARLRDIHFGDSVHTNEEGAKIIAEAVYLVLKEYIKKE